jgi:HlyD family secretion protein
MDSFWNTFTGRKKMLWAILALGLAACDASRNPPDGSGTIECTQVQMAPQVAGRVVKLPVQEGMAVKKGDLVAQIDPQDYELKLAEAKAGLAQAQAQLDLLLAGARGEDIQRAREQVREARAAAVAAEAGWRRTQKVFVEQGVTEKQRDDAQAEAERMAALLAAAEQNLAKLTAGNRKEEIQMAQAAVEQGRARVAQCSKAVADCTVSAPMDGVVTTRSHEEGEMVGVGGTLATLSRLDEVWLSVYLPENQLPKVKLGQSARVKVDGAKELFTGTVTFISPEAEFTPKNVQTPTERAKLVYRVKITLKNPQGFFKPGMPADGFLSPLQ